MDAFDLCSATRTRTWNQLITHYLFVSKKGGLYHSHSFIKGRDEALPGIKNPSTLLRDSL